MLCSQEPPAPAAPAMWRCHPSALRRYYALLLTLSQTCRRGCGADRAMVSRWAIGDGEEEASSSEEEEELTNEESAEEAEAAEEAEQEEEQGGGGRGATDAGGPVTTTIAQRKLSIKLGANVCHVSCLVGRSSCYRQSICTAAAATAATCMQPVHSTTTPSCHRCAARRGTPQALWVLSTLTGEVAGW